MNLRERFRKPAAHRVSTPPPRSASPAMTGLAVLACLVAACGSSGPSTDGADGTSLQIWALQDAQNQPIVQAGIDQFNKDSSVKLAMSTYANDAYKQKLQLSMGSPNAPDVFFNWGGGNLAQFVRAKQVADLGAALAANPTVANAFLPSVLSVGKIDGKQYGLPMNGIQPVILFYNKDVFTAAGLQPPRTYDDLISLVDAFKAKKIIPIALAGSQGWTELMYLEYLLERIGGPETFANIVAGKADAWRVPAVLRALGLCQDLAKRGAFGTSFSGVNYDNTGAGKLLATGMAAMHLMGSWEYSSQLSNNPDFIKSGKMGWVPFPSVSGGTGDPASVVGNPSNYFSVRSGGKHTATAIDFVVKTLSSDAYVTGLIKSGQVPAITGIESKLSGTQNGEFATFTYQLVAKAPSFTQSWDQALSPAAGTELNSALQKLFLSQITPEQFVDTMAKVK